MRAALKKENFELLHAHVNREQLSLESKAFLAKVGGYYRNNNVTEIPLANISDILQLSAPLATPEQILALSDNILMTPDCLAEDLIAHYARIDLVQILSDPAINKDKITESFDNYKQRVTHDVTDEDDELTSEDIWGSLNEPGLNWHLNVLQQGIGPLRKGDFGIVAAYVGQGKTSFICSVITKFAKQIKDGRPILYLNNEGITAKIHRRLWTTALNKTTNTLLEDLPKWEQEYNKAVGKDMIRVVNIMRHSISNLENLIAKVNPSLIILDQIDNIKGFEKNSYATHERYGLLYQWAREIAAYHCPVIGVTQTDATVMKGGVIDEVRGQQYVGMHQLKGSKVDKQAATDFIITIGSDLMSENVRYLNIPKQKSGRNMKGPVNFNPETGIFTNPGE